MEFGDHTFTISNLNLKTLFHFSPFPKNNFNLDIILEKRYIYKIENNDCGIESKYPQFRKSLFIILWTQYFSKNKKKRELKSVNEFIDKE